MVVGVLSQLMPFLKMDLSTLKFKAQVLYHRIFLLRIFVQKTQDQKIGISGTLYFFDRISAAFCLE